MDKCRICLGKRKNLSSIFNNNRSVTFADMITSISNVKIIKDDRISDQICRSCRTKLSEAYEFKLLIERSDAALLENTNFKKVNFNNLSDIKIQIKIDPDCNVTVKQEDMKDYFKGGVNEICYSDTVIKKFEHHKVEFLKTPMPVLDFLQTIKEESNDYDDTFDINDYDPSDGDNDYTPPYHMFKENRGKRKYKKRAIISKQSKISKQRDEKNIRIMPVLRRDLKLVYSYKKSETVPQRPHKYITKPRMCPHCGIMTKTLKSHMRQHTGERSFKCDICSKGYFTKTDLEHHVMKHMNNKEFKCDKCVGAFHDNATLLKHQLVHTEEKKHICSICSKAFRWKHVLLRHIRMHNSANKIVPCEMCNMSFYDKLGLKNHMRVHTGERPYNCEKSNLREHEKRHNLANMKVNCEVCGKKFFSKYQLTHHMRVHTGERQYKCEMCNQPYSYKHDFNRHCFKKHGVFLKRRSVFVMNEQVLAQERILMRDLLLKINGVVKDGEPINPFEGPQAALAFEQAVKALEARQIPIADYM